MAQPSYPGVYVQEIPSGVRTISGVATSVTAFVGYAARGFDHKATRLFSFADYERSFGGLASDSELSYAVQHFFSNGGGEAVVVRVPKADAAAAAVTARDVDNKSVLRFAALSMGDWGNAVTADISHIAGDAKAFNLTLTDQSNGTIEEFPGLTLDATSAAYAPAVVNDPDSGSKLIALTVLDATAKVPVQTGVVSGDITLADVKNDKSYQLKITSDLPTGAITGLNVEIIAVGEAVPTSILGLSRLVERKLTAAVRALVPGSSIRVVPSANGKGLRLWAEFPASLGALDAKLTFAAGVANSILGVLKLSAPTSANVSRYLLGKGRATLAQLDAVLGKDGVQLPTSALLLGSEAAFTGLYALEKVDLFNLLVIPDATRALASNPAKLDPAVDPNAIYSAALAYCQRRRAFLLIDPPPEINQPAAAADWKSTGLTVTGKDAAAYFPRLRLPDPLDDFKLRTFAPSGVIAGLYARTDANRGIWKAPAGTEASLVGVQGSAYKLNDAENGLLNPLGLNCLRSFPNYGNIAWGARTLDGADEKASEWKYVPVRRLALYIEESLFRGTKWIVFEPNDEPLWAQIRLNLGAFMHGLFRQGAFQGKTPREAYLVKCDKDTTTQDDINRGIVNIVVGFAPLKPAEFVFIKIQQLAGQIQA
jgi:phage tail sheath protein FI